MMSTARRAWFEVRDYTQREVESREAYVNALKEDVVAPLVSLRDEQTRIGNRIRDDLKNATASYEEWAFGKVPKLHDKYFHKCDSLEELKRQEHAIAMQAKLLSEAPLPPTPEAKPHPYSRQEHLGHSHSDSTSSLVPPKTSSWASGLSDAADGSPTSPSSGLQNAQPVHQQPEQQRTLQVNHVGNRARSGSASGLGSTVDAKSKEVLSDIAAHSKRGFAAIMQRLGDRRDEDPSPAHDEITRTPTVRRGSVRNTNAMKSVKLKREADEADKVYRSSVFHLESLRLRRHKLHQSAITSLGQYNDELSAVLLVTLRGFTDATHGTAWTLAQSTEVINNAVKSVNLEQDSEL